MIYPSIVTNECVTFEANKFDSHGAFNKSSKGYTIVADGEYLVKDESGTHKKFFRAGDLVPDPEWVLGSGCGIFWKRKIEQLDKMKK